MTPNDIATDLSAVPNRESITFSGRSWATTPFQTDYSSND